MHLHNHICYGKLTPILDFVWLIKSVLMQGDQLREPCVRAPAGPVQADVLLRPEQGAHQLGLAVQAPLPQHGGQSVRVPRGRVRNNKRIW